MITTKETRETSSDNTKQTYHNESIHNPVLLFFSFVLSSSELLHLTDFFS